MEMYENETLIYLIQVCIYLVAGILFKLINDAMYSEMGKQFQKQYNIKSTFVLLLRIGCHV